VSWPSDPELASPGPSRGVWQDSLLPQEAVLGHLLPAFVGSEPPNWLLRRIAAGHAHGVTLFLRANAADADQLSSLAE